MSSKHHTQSITARQIIYVISLIKSENKETVGMYMGSKYPKRNRPAANGHVHGHERKPACGLWACTRALSARKRKRKKKCTMYTGDSRPNRNRPAASGHVHGRFTAEKKPACQWACTRARTERKPACGRRACTQALCARKETAHINTNAYTHMHTHIHVYTHAHAHYHTHLHTCTAQV